MASMNKVFLLGRLGRDPELRYTQSGNPVASLRMATDESYTDNRGQKVERTEWHTVAVWGRSAENCANYLRKGSLCFVEGSLQTRKWQAQDGTDRYSTEIKAFRVQFLDPKGAQQEHGGQDQATQRQEPVQARDDEDLGPAFPSEASGMDETPF